jgi:capsular polysaccharide biosynthesis protein
MICTLLGTSVALAWSLAGPVEYTAKGRVMIATYGSLGTAVDAYSGERVAQLRAPTYAQLIEGSEVATRAAHALGGRFTPESIQSSVNAQISAAMPMLVVSVTAPTPDDAVRILATVEQVFKQYVAQLEQPGRDGSLTGVNLTSDPPEVAGVGNPLGSAALAGLCGFVAGTLLALYRDRTDEVIRNAAQIVRVCPSYRGVVVSEDGLLKAPEETFRRIAIACAPDRWRGAANRILVTGLDAASDGAVECFTRGFASGLAAYGRNVTLVWGRRRADDRDVGGLRDILAGESSWGDSVRAGAVRNLDEVGIGTKDEGIDALIMKHTLGGGASLLQTPADHTVVAGPALTSPSAVALAAHVDSCLLVVTLRKSLLPDLTEAIFLLQGMGIPVIGIVAVVQRRALFQASRPDRTGTPAGVTVVAEETRVEVAVQ